MPDREKVLLALGICTQVEPVDECPYGCPYKFNDGCIRGVMTDALELLKGQEPVEPIRQWDDDETTWWYSCGSCVQAVDYKDKYCRYCGKGLKWE